MIYKCFFQAYNFQDSVINLLFIVIFPVLRESIHISCQCSEKGSLDLLYHSVHICDAQE